MRSTVQQSLEDFPLELKFIKFICLTEMGKSKVNKKCTFERSAYTALLDKVQ